MLLLALPLLLTLQKLLELVASTILCGGDQFFMTSEERREARYQRRVRERQEKRLARSKALALLLLALPLLLTLQKLLELVALGERSHQLFADRALRAGLFF